MSVHGAAGRPWSVNDADVLWQCMSDGCSSYPRVCSTGVPDPENPLHSIVECVRSAQWSGTGAGSCERELGEIGSRDGGAVDRVDVEVQCGAGSVNVQLPQATKDIGQAGVLNVP